MNPIYHLASFHWNAGNIKKAYLVIDEYLKERSGLESFSIEDNFFDFTDRSFWSFLERLLRNSNRRSSFCNTFSILWDDYPNYNLLNLLINKDFTEPSMVKSLGMDQFGFVEPDENFQEILDSFLASAQRGFLTTSVSKSVFDGRTHLDFVELRKVINASNWLNFKDQLLGIEQNLNDIGELAWDKILTSDYKLISSIFLFEAFGEHKREMKDNFIVTTGCLQMNLDWKVAIENSIDQILLAHSDEDIKMFVAVSAQMSHPLIEGRIWLKKLLDYFVNFDENKFYSLYV